MSIYFITNSKQYLTINNQYKFCLNIDISNSKIDLSVEGTELTLDMIIKEFSKKPQDIYSDDYLFAYDYLNASFFTNIKLAEKVAKLISFKTKERYVVETVHNHESFKTYVYSINFKQGSVKVPEFLELNVINQCNHDPYIHSFSVNAYETQATILSHFLKEFDMLSNKEMFISYDFKEVAPEVFEFLDSEAQVIYKKYMLEKLELK